MVKMRGTFLFVFVCACGGTQAEPPDATTNDAADESVTDGPTCPDGQAICFPEAGLADHGAKPDAEIPDADYSPTCADVGRFVGLAMCCDGGYCAGGCFQGVACHCDPSNQGCPWPLVCCLDPQGCVAAEQCNRWWN